MNRRAALVVAWSVVALAWAGVVVAATRSRPLPPPAVVTWEMRSAAAPTADDVFRPLRDDEFRDGDVKAEVSRDQIERGPATLFVRLHDATSKRPNSGRVRLWRLDMAASGPWSAGDQIEAKADVTWDGVEFRDLPTGRYRVELASQGRARPDPEPFELRDEIKSLDVAIHARGTFPVVARIVRTDGTTVDRAILSTTVFAESTPWLPSWARPRTASRESNTFAGCGNDTKAKSAFVQADSDGFDLGEWTEAPHDATSLREWSFELHIDGTTRWLWMPDESVLAGPTTAVAVLPSDDEVLAGVRSADGARPALEVRKTSFVVLVPRPAPPDAWRRAPVHVFATSPFVSGVPRKEVEFTWTVATADERHGLVTKSSK